MRNLMYDMSTVTSFKLLQAPVLNNVVSEQNMKIDTND